MDSKTTDAAVKPTSAKINGLLVEMPVEYVTAINTAALAASKAAINAAGGDKTAALLGLATALGAACGQGYGKVPPEVLAVMAARVLTETRKI